MDDKAFEASLEQMGEANVRANLEHPSQFGADAAKARAWLNKREAARQDEQRQAMFASVRSADEAAQVARESAEASRRSAMWTMIAAIVSALGLVINTFNSLGWLDWAKHTN
ncbi:hypothetical protein [Paraburkholderia terrae]